MLMWVRVVAAFVGMCALIDLYVRKVGCCCHKCGRRMAFWDELETAQQQDISSYFCRFENRQVDTQLLCMTP